jgi:hypothetical protein
MSLTREDQSGTAGETMTGTPSQVEWAERIKLQANAEFDRVANAFRESADSRSKQDRLDIDAIISILEQKRLEVMARDEAGYFIRDWQELSDQVRRLIRCDPAYQAIRARREAPSRQMHTEQLFDETGRTE